VLSSETDAGIIVPGRNMKRPRPMQQAVTIQTIANCGKQPRLFGLAVVFICDLGSPGLNVHLGLTRCFAARAPIERLSVSNDFVTSRLLLLFSTHRPRPLGELLFSGTPRPVCSCRATSAIDYDLLCPA